MANRNGITTETTEDATSISFTISELSSRAKDLLSELETFRQHLRSIRQEQDVEVAHFRGAVQAEVGMLDRLSKKLDDVNTGHVARSSNVPFLESVWDSAKRSEGPLKAVQKLVYYNSPSRSMSQAMRHVRIRSGNEAKNAKVTVVSIFVNTVLIHSLIVRVGRYFERWSDLDQVLFHHQQSFDLRSSEAWLAV